MNIPQTIENAIRDTLTTYAADTLPASWIHCAQCGTDFANMEANEAFPQVLISSSTKYLESEGTTLAVSIEVGCATWFLDDPACEQRASMYEETERVLDGISSYCSTSDQTILDFFIGRVQETLPSFTFGGFTPEQTSAEIFDGVQLIAYAGTLHFSL